MEARKEGREQLDGINLIRMHALGEKFRKTNTDSRNLFGITGE